MVKARDRIKRWIKSDARYPCAGSSQGDKGGRQASGFQTPALISISAKFSGQIWSVVDLSSACDHQRCADITSRSTSVQFSADTSRSCIRTKKNLSSAVTISPVEAN